MDIRPFTNNNISAYAGGSMQRGRLGVAPVLPVEQLSSRLHEERVIDGELLDREVHATNSSKQTGFTFDGNSQRESHPGFYQRQQAGSHQHAIDSYKDTEILGQSRESAGVQNSVDYFA